MKNEEYYKTVLATAIDTMHKMSNYLNGGLSPDEEAVLQNLKFAVSMINRESEPVSLVDRNETHHDTWDIRFMELARLVSSWSKDPTTQVGAVIVDDKHRVVSVAYNGFPRGVHDREHRLEDREMKLHMTMHAEQNAILFAQRNLQGCTLYTWPIQCCAQCAAMIIQSGIKRVVSPNVACRPEWRKSFDIANHMFEEANVEMSYETL